jgi:hypothetical protein
MRSYLQLWLGGLFLQDEAYAYQRDRKNPFASGLLFVSLIGFLTALASILGAGVRYAISPSADAVKNTVLAHLQAVPYFVDLPAAQQQVILAGIGQVWDNLAPLFVGYPTTPAGVAQLLAGVVTTPIAFVIVWLIYGALIHLVARGWNAETSYPELLAPLALASAPQALTILNVFPASNVGGVVLALWTLVCNIVAVRVAYKTTPGRAVWGALFPLLLFSVFMLVIAVIAYFALLNTLARGVP